jgi:hypothetical protein
MTDAEIQALIENQENVAAEAEAPEDTDVSSVSEEMNTQGSVEMTSEGKVREAPVGFEGLITTDQDVLSNAERKYQIVLEGVCTGCAHCGMPLRDAVSVQRGIGPICSKRGYLEDPEEPGDPIEAMYALAKWPHLVNLLVKESKGLDKGDVRELLNGLVRICSLNRRTDVHDACTDAIETLGYTRLASMLRESLCAAEIRESKDNPSFYVLWIKKSEWTPQWRYDYRNAFPNSQFSRKEKGMLFPKDPVAKRQVWGLLLKHYEGLCAKVPGGKAVRIRRPQTSN